MSELKQLEEKMVSLFEGVNKRFDDVDTELKMIRFEMESESARLQDSISNLDNKVGNLEILAIEKWNVPEKKIELI